MEGWIKLYRKITDWEWYDNPIVFKVFVDLLISANHQDKKWHGQVVERGSLITSISQIATRNGLTIQQVRTAIKKLCETGEINKQVTNKNTMIIVLKYTVYQDFMSVENETTNKQITNKQQTTNKQLTTNKNERMKELKNIYKESIREKTPTPKEKYGKYGNVFLTGSELDTLKKELPNRYSELIDNLSEYMESTGKSYKSHFATIRRWAKADIKKGKKDGNLKSKPSYDLDEIKRKAEMNTEI